MPLFRRSLTDGDLAQMTIIHINDTIPSDSLRVDVEARETVGLFWRELIRVRLVDSELLQAL